MRTAAIALLLLASACSRQDPVADNANGAALPQPKNMRVTDAAGAPPPQAQQEPVTGPSSKTGIIPAALQGRWGLTPADCTSTRGDAKGLLIISASELRFYESRAVPGANVEAHADRISGNFDFSGEGQRWTKFEAIRAGGDKLVRTESDPETSYAYAKC